METKPDYYRMDNGLDVIANAFAYSLEAGAAFCRWTVAKYLTRAGKKDRATRQQDMAKAQEFLWRWQRVDERAPDTLEACMAAITLDLPQTYHLRHDTGAPLP